MSNVLEFALGLESSNFLRELGLSSRGVLSFAGAMEGVRFGAEKMWGEIEKGAALEGLAARTNQTTQGLYRMQMGFAAVGLGADAVPGLILKMQRSLSGLNEMGGRTDSVFAQLGLNIQQLRGLTAEQQINAVGTALAKLNTSSASGAASALFGRFGAGDMLQIARSLQEYQRVMTATRGDASVFGAMAHAWQEIEGDAKIFESHINAVWAAIASGITPELHKVLDEINNITGALGPAIAQAFASGQINDLVKLSLMAGLEQGAYYGEQVFDALAVGFGDALAGVLVAVFDDIAPLATTALANAAAISAAAFQKGSDEASIAQLEAVKKRHARGEYTIGEVNDPAEIDRRIAKFKADIPIQQGTILALGNQVLDELHTNVKSAVEHISTGIVQGVNSAKASLTSSDKNAPHAATDRLANFILGLSSQWQRLNPEAPGKPSAGAPVQFENHYKPEFTSLEKMGFVMNRGSLMHDAARQTAINTRRMADGMTRLLEYLSHPTTPMYSTIIQAQHPTPLAFINAL